MWMYYYRHQGCYLFISICELACLSAGLLVCKNYLTNFHRIRWKGGTWSRTKLLDSGGNLDYITLGLVLCLRLSGAVPHSTWKDCYLASA